MTPRMLLLIANSRDFATDFVVAELRRRGEPYERLDLDLAEKDHISLDPIRRALRIVRQDRDRVISETDLSGVLYRAPTHLRESSAARHDPEDLLARHQWAAFARSLMVFDHARWMNYPKHTFAAENKPFQLALASRLGFKTPATVVGNYVPSKSPQFKHRLAVKALDTFLIRTQGVDAFFYTQLLDPDEAAAANLQQMPVIMQEAFDDKIDIRVTVVGEKCFAVTITRNEQGIAGDWRLTKDSATFAPIDLPHAIRKLCIALTRELGLVFGAIDLIQSRGEYYFLEINPTGEWAWLVETAGQRIDCAITDWLVSG